MKPDSPVDLMGVYLTPQMGIGQRLRLDTIQRELARMPLIPTLDMLAQIAFRADDSISDPSK